MKSLDSELSLGDWGTRSAQRPLPDETAAETIADLGLAPPCFDGASLDSWCASLKQRDDQLNLVPDLSQFDPDEARKLVSGLSSMPAIGHTFLGFQLIAELGRGAFGRVYLARQGDLANRYVALKVSADLATESQKLAQLQHTNIMPVYSFHKEGSLQAVCMPFLGATTLADVLTGVTKDGSMPDSGRSLVNTLHNRHSMTYGSIRRGMFAELDAKTTVKPLPDFVQPTLATQTLHMLEDLSYVDAVLWIAGRVADGLSHAHDHGIYHRDLKPANILLTDEGQPMLLDFNLAEDTKARHVAAVIGGTLPFMSPEHLEAFQGHPRTLDHRSDIYSLGLILFELLSGRSAFPRLSGSIESVVPQIIKDRSRTIPSLRSLNPAVSPALESIVRKCLDYDPARRYQNAHHLREDITRHRENLPLKHAPNLSWSERVGKWRRRHPRLMSGWFLGAAAVLIVAGLSLALVANTRRLEGLQANAGQAAFDEKKNRAKLLMSARDTEASQQAEGVSLAREAIEPYGLLDLAEWRQRAAYSALNAESQKRLERDLGDLLLLMCESAIQQGDLNEAMKFNRAAEQCYPAGEAPRALHVLRAALLKKNGNEPEADRETATAKAIPPRNSWDEFLLSRELFHGGEVRLALEGLQRSIAKDPRNSAAWLLMGHCYLDGFGDRHGHDGDAIAKYSTGIALQPKYAPLYINRGVAYLRLKLLKEAEADFTTAIELRPELFLGYLHRGKTRLEQGRLKDALADLEAAIKREATGNTVLFLKAQTLWQLGEKLQGMEVWQEAMKLEPKDEESAVARGAARLQPLDPLSRVTRSDFEAALADFEIAVKLNERSMTGLHNQAHVLAELGKTEEAIKKLDTLLKYHPEVVSAISGRGVLRARLGRDEDARADAKAALERDDSGYTLFQVAGIYALTSKRTPDDKKEALRLLSLSMKKGFGHDDLETDSDLDPIRGDASFREMLSYVRGLKKLAIQGAKPAR